MLIITGLGRCGTSMVAHWCKEMGFDPGSEWLAEYQGYQINAGFEDEKAREINFYLGCLCNEGKLDLIGGRDDDIREVAASRQVIKDPRFVIFHPGVFDRWCEVLPGKIRVLLLLRDIEAIVKSRRAAFVEELSMEDPEKNLAAFMQTLRKRQVKFSTLTFPGFLKNYFKFALIMKYLGLEFDTDKGQKVWDQIVDFKKVRF